ncbi:hypothetical protein SCLCIDRAFT_1183790 [Scleroderma citrinum Foug A]|uniref:Uncharacterized protein n=1 Tax=Scleroderma citrinum Foug A TaxID=1036808 RepID=A0A0C3A6K9_9AGAM|nr:hypothetical protein SCLCIDRAFT_1183790 [Scleroderma citrinum Foug A]
MFVNICEDRHPVMKGKIFPEHQCSVPLLMLQVHLSGVESAWVSGHMGMSLGVVFGGWSPTWWYNQWK